jgi:uncharacterized protein YcfJ
VTLLFQEELMNKSMIVGVVAGIAVATAGGVLGFQYLGQKQAVDEQGSNVVAETPAAQEEAPIVVARAAEPAAAPAPRPAAAPKPAAPKPTVAAAPKPAAAPAEECWDEEVAVTADPKDDKKIAGTALGAVVGGSIGNDIGHSKLTTAATAAAGALIGRKIQEKIQDKNADKRTETRVERRCGPPGSRPQ